MGEGLPSSDHPSDTFTPAIPLTLLLPKLDHTCIPLAPFNLTIDIDGVGIARNI